MTASADCPRKCIDWLWNGECTCAPDTLDLSRLIAIKWGDKIIDPAEVVYVLRGTT